MNKLESECVKLLTALVESGEVYANSGGVYKQRPFEFLMHTTDLFHVIQHLRGLDIHVVRVDSGGQPTWRLA